MPAFTFTNTPSLELIRLGKHYDSGSTAHGALPAEREISRQALLEIAPDREALLMSNKSIDEIRQELKLCTVPKHGHWLYTSQHRVNFKLQDTTARTSAFIYHSTASKEKKANATRPRRENENGITTLIPPPDAILDRSHSVRRRALSASSLHPLASSIENTLFQHTQTWGELLLSTQDKLISPRPLGPTHILILHSAPSLPPTTITQSTRRTIQGPTLEVPINDLLFILNVPNLANPSALPHRLPAELPRVLLKVRHLQTFPALIVYLHTKNQAELFRQALPEWIRDLIHPLPSRLSYAPSISSVESKGKPRAIVKKKKSQVLRRGSKDSGEPIPPVPPLPSSGRCSPSVERTIDSIAREIAEVDAQLSQPDTPEGLVAAATALNALKDNMEDIGFHGKAVWQELDVSAEILTKAISWKARLAGKCE